MTQAVIRVAEVRFAGNTKGAGLGIRQVVLAGEKLGVSVVP